jgi:hypothetical protein
MGTWCDQATIKRHFNSTFLLPEKSKCSTIKKYIYVSLQDRYYPDETLHFASSLVGWQVSLSNHFRSTGLQVSTCDRLWRYIGMRIITIWHYCILSTLAFAGYLRHEPDWSDVITSCCFYWHKGCIRKFALAIYSNFRALASECTRVQNNWCIYELSTPVEYGHIWSVNIDKTA